jgi:hypothetical protein
MDPISTQLLAASQKEQNYDGSLAAVHENSPHIAAYPFTAATGFGARYSNPNTLPPSATQYPNSVTFTKDTTILAWPTNTNTGTNQVFFYGWNKATGFGLRIADLSGVSYSLLGAVTTKVSEYGAGYNYILFSSVNGSIYRFHVAEYANINQVNSKATGYGGSTEQIKFNNAGTYVLGSSGLLRVYPWTDGWPASTTNLGTPVELSGTGISWHLGDWHPSDTVIVVGNLDTPGYLRAYNFGGTWGSLLSSATSPLTSMNSVCFSPSGKTVFTVGDDSPYLKAYAFDQTTGFGSAFSNPATVPTGACYTVVAAKTNDLVAVCSNAHPYILVYPWDDSTGFGTKYSDPSSLPAGRSRAIAFM